MSLGLAVLLGLALLVNERPAVAAGPCGPPVVSVIACENTLPGDPPSDWDVSGAGDSTIQGFATSMSVNVGQTVNFKINTPATSYHIDILRLGWYQGDGARKVVSNMLPTATLPQTQPACINDTQPTGLIDCGKWTVSASWTVPSNAVSGLYLAHLVRNDTGGSSLIPFVVRNDASHSGILFQTADETWQAYNNYGGNSLYDCTVNCPPGNPAAYKGADAVSYNRPWIPGGPSEGSWLFYAEFPMIEFLEENGYDVSYTSGVDMSQPGAASIIEQHKIFLTAGHDEYWSAQQRANVTAARGAGVNLAFFTGNEVFWKTRFAPSIDGSSTPNRTLVTYKETHYNSQTDPQDPPTWTGSWMDPRFSPPGDGGAPQNSLTGQLFDVNDGTADIKVPSQYSKLRFWRNTRVASLSSGQSTTLDAGVGTLGYEWDVDADNGFRPPGLMDLSSTTDTSVQPFLDYGSTTTTADTATVTHHLTLYRAPSGALVFGAGTVQWSWGLASGAGPPRNSDSAMQQATVNVFADMGNVQPYSLMAGLTPATPSTDTTPPTSTITSPSQGATFSDGAQTTISGTATDAGGGVVAGVEISTDGGTTWHPVTTMSAANTSVTWSYSWIAHGSPTTTIKSRAVDDSGNLETPGSGITIQVNCPCSIWGTHVTPTTVDSGDPASTEVGVKFQSDTNGYITGIRFYKASANTGTHVGNLWTATGQLLASATFTNETASGWQQVNFSQPVAVNKNTTYVASYFAPNGHYSQDGYYFYTTPPMGTNPTITNVDSPPLHALRNTNGVTNGVYSYAGSSTFPTGSANASNYYVDPVFSPAFTNPPGPVSNVSASAGNASANVTWSAPTSGDPVTAYTVTPYIGSAAQTPTTVTGTSATVSGLTNGTTYTFTVTPSNPAGSGPQSSPSNAVTPSVPPSVSGVTPSAGLTGNAVSVAPSATFSQPVTPSTVSFTVKDSAGNSVAGSVGFNAADTVATFTPSSSLVGGTMYTATVSGAQNASGTPMSSPYSWSFSTGAVAQCPCSIWQNGTPAGSSESNDPNAQTSGVKFQASGSGFITGVRFYKEPDDTGAHVGSLWSSSGTLLASGTFSGETASGWQELDFSSPVAVTGGTTYVASYFSHTGYPASTSQGLASGVTNGPLTALAGGGVYAYGGSNTFPTNTWNNSNYWVDVVYSPTSGATSPGAPTGVSATSGNGSATVSWTAPGSGGSAITSYTVTPYVGSAAQTPVTVSGSPPATSATVPGLTNGTAYTFTVSATNAVGTGPASSPSNAVTPSAPTAPGAPTGVSATSGNGSATVSWTAPGNGGSAITSYTVTPYVGSAAQTPVTVSGSPPATSATVSGLTNGTSYTFRVSATNAVGTGPASSPSNAVTPSPPPAVTSVTPGSGATGVAVSVAPSATFSQPVTPSTASFTVKDSAGNTVAGSVGFNAADTVATFTPSSSLASSTTYTATVSGAQNASGTPMSSPFSWNFTTAGPQCPCSIWNNGTPTGAVDSNDPNAQTSGVKFTAASSGFITGVRFYKEADDTGAHVGSLWSSSGTLLASGTFSNETASGWQELDFSSPVAVTAGTTYVASYFSSTGHPASTSQGLASAVTNGPLTALAGGGVYAYGGSNTFPTNTWNNSNYWVDVVYSQSAGTTPPSVSGVTPSAGSTGNAVSVAPSATFSQPVTPSTVSFTVKDSAGNSVAGSVGFNAADTVATFTPSSSLVGGTMYTATVSGAQNASGTPMSSPYSWSFSTGAVAQCPCSIWQNGTPAGSSESNDPNAQTSGVKFQASGSGFITGVRFYKEPDDTGAHVGSLWSSSGTLLASGTFSGETASGWQELDFSSPVAVTGGTTYVASYFSHTGYPASTSQGLASGVTNGPLTALAGGGVYAYGGSNTFPTNTWNNSNYWVNVVYSPTSGATSPGAPTGVSATSGNGSATVSWTAPGSGGSAITSYTVTPYVGSAAQTPVTVSGSPPATSATVPGLTNGTAYTFTVSATNAVGTGPASSPSNAVTPSAPTAPGAPTGVSATSGNGSATVSWTAPGNGGSAITSYTVTPYVGSAAQTPVTVSGSPPATSATVSGLTNGTSYTFRVSATNAVGTGPASSPSNAVTPSPPPAVTSVTPGSGATGVAVSVAPSATFSQPVTPSTASFTVKDSAGNTVAGSVGFNAADTVATFTPSSSLASSTTYTATVSGAQNASGTPMSSPFSWNFTTAGPQCPCSIWNNGTPTGAVDSNDPNAQTSGVKFTAASSGFITGVRFYKEADDTGAHVGSLWSSSGTLLASGTFSNETASGWQELDFSSPVAVTAGTTYVASYFSSTGHPASTSQGLASAVTNGPLTALAGGGVYAYGGSNTFPTNTYNANNYWVDVVYSPS